MSTFIILVLVLGAAGLFLTLPGGRMNTRGLGWLLLSAGGALLLALLVQAVAGSAARGWFAGCALVAVFAAVRVITHPRPVYSALYFVLLVVAVTGLLLLMQAEFLAVALALVYAGAILVTYVFVIMLAQQSRPATYDTHAREPLAGCSAGFLLLAVMATELFSRRTASSAASEELKGTVERIGSLLLTDYVIGVEIIGVLLLAAMVGAIAIARRRVEPAPEEGGVD